MARKRDSGWEDDFFIDFQLPEERPRSRPASSRPPSSRGDRPPARPPSSKRPASSGRRPPPGREYPPPSRRGRPPQNQEKRRKPKKAMSKKSRRLLLTLLFLVMGAITAVLCIFLLFKINDIQIVGDKVYEDQDVLSVCNVQEGDNLIFLATSQKEVELKQALPYIGEVHLRRKLPGTLEIEIKAASASTCIESGGSWLYVSKENKILDRKDSPMPGAMQVVGIVPVDVVVGAYVKLEDESVQAAYDEITAKIGELNAGEQFTKLDLTNLYDIKLLFEDRIEFQLGSAADLSYKVEFGYRNATEKIGPEEKGILDLSLAGEVKRASFTTSAAETASSAPSSGVTSSAGDKDTSSTGGETSQPQATTSPREEGIPDAPFTGTDGSTDSAGGDDGGAADTGTGFTENTDTGGEE